MWMRPLGLIALNPNLCSADVSGMGYNRWGCQIPPPGANGDPRQDPASAGWVASVGGEDGRAGINGAEIKNGKEKEEKREAKVEIQLLFRAGAGGEESACYTAFTPPLLNSIH